MISIVRSVLVTLTASGMSSTVSIRSVANASTHGSSYVAGALFVTGGRRFTRHTSRVVSIYFIYHFILIPIFLRDRGAGARKLRFWAT